MEIIPKESLKPSKSSNVLLYFSLIFLFLSIASFFILNHFVDKLKKEVNVLESVFIEKMPAEKREVLSYQEKIDDFSFLIEQRLESSKFFTAFEKIVHPQVWFSRINLNLRDKRVILSGHAESLEILKQQIFIFQNNKALIKEVDFTIDVGTIFEAEELNFNLSLILNPKLFNN